MTIKNEKLYLLQLVVPFIVLGYFKSPYFYFGIIPIIICIPFKNARRFFIVNWMKFGNLMQKIVSPALIGFIYFLVLTPLAVFRRMITKNSDLDLSCPVESNLKDLNDQNQEPHYKELW